MRLYKGYKKHYQYQTLVNLLLLLFLFVILAFVIKNYFKPFFIIIVLLIISNPMYDLIKKIIQKKEIAGALTILLINVLNISSWGSEHHLFSWIIIFIQLHAN